MVAKGDTIQIEKVDGDAGSAIKFDKVLFTADAKTQEVGKPYIAGSVVEGKIKNQARGRKIHVLKYKSKSKYRRKIGHRQHYTEVEITKV